MLEIMILRSQLASITLQMLVIHFVPYSWYPIEMCVIILLNGAVQISGELVSLLVIKWLK
jgi:hypothetical protein